MDQSTRLRELIASEGTLYIPGAYSAISAKLIEQAGFPACYMTGLGTSLAILGKPDCGFITMTEMLQTARHIVNAISIPLIADCDDGYGNAVNTMRAVREYIQAGVAAVHIEDEFLPRRSQKGSGKSLVSTQEACGKIKAADQIRRDMNPDFLLIARTDARHIQDSLDEAIARANSYLEAGADMAFVNKPVDLDEVKRITEEVQGPLFYNQTGVSPRLTIDEMREFGISIAIDSTMPLRVMLSSVGDYLTALRERGPIVEKEAFNRLKDHPLSDTQKIAGIEQIRRWEKEFLPTE